MTPAEFHRVLAKPSIGQLLDRMLEENARIDAEIAERQQRETNEEIYLRYVKGWFARTGLTVGEP